MDRSIFHAPLKPPPAQNLTPVPGLAWFRGRRFWLLPLGALLLLGLLILLQASTSGVLHILIAEIPPEITLSSAFCGAFWVSLRLPKGPARRAWRYISLAFLCYLVAECIETGLSFAGFDLMPPSPASPFIASSYPLLIVGLLLLPSPSLSRSARGRLMVDAGSITCAALGLSLLTIIAPLWNNVSTISIAGKIFLTAYPLGDVALISTIVLLLLRSTEHALRPVLIWMALGIGLLVYADSALNILTLQNHHLSNSPFVDPFSTTGEFLMGLSAWFYLIHGTELSSTWIRLIRVGEATSHNRWQRWFQQYVFPYFSMVLLLLLIVAREQLPPSEGSSAYILEALALTIIVLMITRQILLSNDLVDAQVANQRAQQLDALKDQFITSVNHELRTPLMTMQTYIELLRFRQKELPERSGKLVEEIGRTNDALVDLVQSILEVRRLDHESHDFSHEAVNLQSTLEQATALINPREARVAGRTLHVDIAPDLAVWGETVRVQQVLTNLLSNAIKYSPSDTAIEVSATVVQVESGKFMKPGKSRPMVEIQVRDYGLGIPPEQVPLLFRRFVRLPRDLASNVVGSGLGLYLCQNLTTGMGGRIWVESEGVPGQGSTFHVQLPLAEMPVARQKVVVTGELSAG